MDGSNGMVPNAGMMATRRALLAGIGLGALALPLAGRAVAQEAEPDEEITVFGTSGDNGGMIGSPEELVLLSKERALAFSTALEVGSLLIVIAGVALVASEVGGGAGLGLLGAGGIGLMLSFWLHQYALDPPRPDFRVAERLILTKVRFPSATLAALPALAPLSRSGNVLVPTAKCLLDSVERYWGAKAAGDAEWMQRKRIGHDHLVANLAFQLQQYSRAHAELAAQLKTNPAVNAAMFSRFRAIMADDNQRVRVYQRFSELGFGPEAIRVLDQKLRSAAAGSIKPDTAKRVLTSLAAESKVASAYWTELLYRMP